MNVISLILQMMKIVVQRDWVADHNHTLISGYEMYLTPKHLFGVLTMLTKHRFSIIMRERQKGKHRCS